MSGNRITIEPFQRPSVLASTSTSHLHQQQPIHPTHSPPITSPKQQQQQSQQQQLQPNSKTTSNTINTVTSTANRLTILRYKQMRLNAAKIRAKAKRKMVGPGTGSGAAAGIAGSSAGKRLPKRSIVGTRVCAMGSDRLWYAGAITNVKLPPSQQQRADACSPPNAAGVSIGAATGESKYTVRFDAKQDLSALGLGALHARRLVREFSESELIGPGFQSVLSAVLQPGQRVYITHNGRESAGEVIMHDETKDEVTVRLPPGQGNEVSFALHGMN